MKNRNIKIDTLRGIACLLLVAFHVVGVNSNSGLKIDAGLYRDLNDAFAYIRMPLFSFISGLVYAYRPFSENSVNYIKGKFRRLIIPMLVVGTFFAALQSIILGESSVAGSWYLLHVIPIAHFWFVEALFIIFLIMIPLELLGCIKSKRGFLLVFLASCTLYLSDFNWRYFSLSGVLYMLPYFLIGLGFERFSMVNLLSRRVGVALLLGVVALLIANSCDVIEIGSRRSLLGLVVALMACVSLLSVKIESTLISCIGLFSYSIYIYHVFFTASSRIILNKMGVVNIELLFSISLLLGVLGPITTEKLFDYTNLTRMLFLGKRTKP